MDDGLTHARWEFLVQARDGASLERHLQDVLAGRDDLRLEELELSSALGMNAREAVLTVVLGFGTSVSANFATDALKEIIATSGDEAARIEEVTPAEQGGTDSVPPQD